MWWWWDGGGGVGKEGWKLDERGRLSHQPDRTNSSLFFFSISLFITPLRICVPKKTAFARSCVALMRGPSLAHAFSP